nr:cyclase family protein [uncultured Sphaerochaeta sp.]
MIPVSVVGIRFDQFPPSTHSKFSFTEKQLSTITIKLRKQTRSDAVILLSTCDRVEVWCENPQIDCKEPFLRVLSLPVLIWAEHTYSIFGEEAIEHLFALASGLLSPLFGEDQIISQIHTSLLRSRIHGCASPHMEYLFREAITTAKAVQSKVDLQVPDESLPEAVLTLLEKREVDKKVLLIGSSALARLVAKVLCGKGYKVTMTFRDLEKAELLLPEGVMALAYEERFDHFASYSVVLSATKGMEYTVDLDSPNGPGLYIDLAPVRDINPVLAERKGVEVLTLKDFSVPLPRREAATAEARNIVSDRLGKALHYLTYRHQVEAVQRMAGQAANDLVYRLNSMLVSHKLDLDFRKDLYETARKAFSHQLYQERKREAAIQRYDLSICLESGHAIYDGDPDTILEPLHTIEREGWALTRLSLGSHTGTHMDSPSHLLKEGKTLDTYPLSRFFATAYVMDCRNLEMIDPEDIPELDSSCNAVLFCTDGNAQLSMASVHSLLARGVRLFGFDTPNCDRSEDISFPVHHAIFAQDALILENLVNLDKVVSRVVQLTCLPLSFKKADGSPTRVIATIW